MRIRLGTPMRLALAQQGLESMDGVRVIHGGPMMGELMRSVDIPMLKGTNGILAMQHKSIMLAHYEEEPCIRCGDCGEACPIGLMPNLLANHCKEEQFERAEDYNLFDCIECGACSYVCPSHIPLVHYFRFGKGQIAQIRREKSFSEESRVRSDAREARIAQEHAAKEEKRRIAREKKEARAKQLAETAAKEAAEQESEGKADLSQENKS
ncbi:MAG: 4Fe-4S dicluster domain-containing protein [Ghiorsea sp.]